MLSTGFAAATGLEMLWRHREQRFHQVTETVMKIRGERLYGKAISYLCFI